jgi:hypothetical protein
MDNSGTEYREISRLIQGVIGFRDTFAHPKLCKEKILDLAHSELAAIPAIAWEPEIDVNKIECDYQELERYSTALLDAAAKSLEEAYARGWDVWQQKYPHLADLHLEAAYLKVLIYSNWHSSADLG